MINHEKSTTDQISRSWIASRHDKLKTDYKKHSLQESNEILQILVQANNTDFLSLKKTFHSTSLPIESMHYRTYAISFHVR